MPVNRDLWNKPLTRREAPTWPCATCAVGHLTAETDTLIAEQTAESKAEQAEEYWDPSMWRGRFMVALRCSNRKCRDLAIVAGDIVVEEDYDHDTGEHLIGELLLPRHFSPTPNLITLPSDTPETVSENIREACQLVWAEPAAAGNRIRTAVEFLMDDLHVRRKRRTAKSKFELLTLHKRIEEFSQKQKALGDSLLAVKWLGNAGTHSELRRTDVFDALDIVEHVLDEVYIQRARAVAKLARAINRAKGPVRGASKR